MIGIFDVWEGSTGIKIKLGEAGMYGDRILIGKASTWTGTVVELVDELGKVNAIIPIELFTEDAIEKIKSFTNTERSSVPRNSTNNQDGGRLSGRRKDERTRRGRDEAVQCGQAYMLVE